uniref:PHD-type domain-containing protein n=1 Tax=Oryza punctata TaxID=4537 RepID=A0A0E0LAX0_ORYPU
MGSGRERKRRRRRRGNMGRVAEMVMVLAVAGQARGGTAPTAAERALAAGTRERLLEAAEMLVRPRELFPREAVRALVEDLGLTRGRDPSSMGYRPRRASIAERILLTKRKMEEIKEAPLYPTTNVPQTTASRATTVFQHGASKPTTALPMNISAVASFPVTTPPTIPSPNILKQTQLNESPSGASSVKAAGASSIVSLPSVCPTNIKVEKGVNNPNCTQNGATIGQANKSAHHTATMSSRDIVCCSSHEGTPQHEKAPVIRPTTINNGMTQQSRPGASSVQRQSTFSNHIAIAKMVQQVLHQPVNHPNWTPPSTEYMISGLGCQVCKVSIVDIHSMIVCDACERGIHLKCLQHDGVNVLPPKAEWYCPTCVAHSNGKPLPPKYGKVTRTGVAPKVNLINGVLSQGVSENPTTKDNSQELAADGTVIDKNSSEVNRIVHNSDKLALESSKEQSQSVSASAAVDKGRGKPQGVETMENNAMSERDAKDQTIVCSPDHSIVGWVGDPLKVVENKTYYYSCNIDGIAYNLDDHILVASEDKESAPSKLQSLWEEHDSRSKMALVFASYNQRTVTVSVICGPCEVLPVDKFREETKGSQVVSSKLHPIFLFRLMVESRRVHYKIYLPRDGHGLIHRRRKYELPRARLIPLQGFNMIIRENVGIRF